VVPAAFRTGRPAGNDRLNATHRPFHPLPSFTGTRYPRAEGRRAASFVDLQ
jgi:hypothetical protein